MQKLASCCDRAKHLERAGKIDIVVLDKTGTITKGQPVVTDIIVLNDHGNKKEEELRLLRMAASVEKASEHPLGEAIVAEAGQRGIALELPDEFSTESGMGVRGSFGWQPDFGGE